MRLKARFSAGSLQRRFARLESEVEKAALDAAGEALAAELAQVRGRENLAAPLVRGRDARRRFVGADDPESLARELGSPSGPPAPWLAPSLPGARAPMRAAVFARVRDVVAVHAGKHRRAVARALSRFRR